MDGSRNNRFHQRRDDIVEGPAYDVQSAASAQIDDREWFRANDPPDSRVDFEQPTHENLTVYIREDFLESLGIQLPLTNWVTVTNFQCDKLELKEVFELAGRVLVCSVYLTVNKYANIMYSHPLEAVQAISMLNGQKLFGLTLKVTMKNSRDTDTLLPKGLADVGPGLGKYGKTLPDLVEQLKRFVEGQNSSIDANLFQPDFLRKIGVDLERDTSTPFVRLTPSNSSSMQHDNVSDQESDTSACYPFVRNNGNLFGAIGQRILHASTPTPVTVHYRSNCMPTFIPMNQPILIRGANSTLMPIPSGSTPRPRHIAPISNPITNYVNCPNINRSPMPSPMGPMRRPSPVNVTHLATTNRFPSPGPRNFGPVTGPTLVPTLGPGPNPNIQIARPIIINFII